MQQTGALESASDEVEVNFSLKYQPLFDILRAGEELDKLQLVPEEERSVSVKRQMAYYRELQTVHTVLMSGGRDSGKTFAESLFNGVAASDWNHRILYTRYTLTSADDSIYTAQKARLEILGVEEEYNCSGKDFHHKYSPGKIVILGQKTSSGNQTAKLKSLENFSIFVTEEGEELTNYDEWVKIKRSIRATDVQCLSIIVFNPPTKAHWLYEQFYSGIPAGFNGVRDGVLYIHTTYLDNGRQNMAEHNWEEYEELRQVYEYVESLSKEQRAELPRKIIRKWKEYKFKILGGFQEVAEGVIYEDWDVGEFDLSLPYCFGLDFGSSDPDALVKVAIDHKNKYIYAKQEYYRNNTSANALIAILDDRVGFVDLVVADCENRRLILDIDEYGINIRPAHKFDGSVKETIKTIQGYTLIVDPNSLDLQTALNNYVWQDGKAGIPRREWKHLPDAIGYAVMYLLHGDKYDINW